MDYLFSYYNAEPTRSRFFTPNNLTVSASGFSAVAASIRTSCFTPARTATSATG